VARSCNRLGLEEEFTAERKAWFPLASTANSGNLVAVSFKLVTFRTVELSQEPWGDVEGGELDCGVGSDETGVTAEETAKRTGTKKLRNMLMDRPAETNVKQRGERSRKERRFVVKS
jgi:hypothetical protein